MARNLASGYLPEASVLMRELIIPPPFQGGGWGWFMSKLFNKKSQKKLRQHLRNQIILSERLLWKRLQKNQLGGYKFRRQQGIGSYIVDFYCPKLSLVVELDGDTHADDDAIKHDKKREDFLKNNGMFVKRYLNQDVKRNMEYVLEDLLDFCKNLDKQ